MQDANPGEVNHVVVNDLYGVSIQQTAAVNVQQPTPQPPLYDPDWAPNDTKKAGQ